MSPERILCHCLQVTEGEIRAAVRERGLMTVEQVTGCTEAGDGCTACHVNIEAVIREENRARIFERVAASV